MSRACQECVCVCTYTRNPHHPPSRVVQTERLGWQSGDGGGKYRKKHQHKGTHACMLHSTTRDGATAEPVYAVPLPYPMNARCVP